MDKRNVYMVDTHYLQAVAHRPLNIFSAVTLLFCGCVPTFVEIVRSGKCDRLNAIPNRLSLSRYAGEVSTCLRLNL